MAAPETLANEPGQIIGAQWFLLQELLGGFVKDGALLLENGHGLFKSLLDQIHAQRRRFSARFRHCNGDREKPVLGYC